MLSHRLNERRVPEPQAATPLHDFSQDVCRLNDLEKLWGQVAAARDKRVEPYVMIVDDDEFTRGVISHTLKKDYPILTAVDAVDAVRKHMLHAPNVVFLDVDLPDYSGFEFLRHIRRYDPFCQVVMFTGNNYLDNRLTAFANGAAGFIAKPFRRKTFEHYIDLWRRRFLNQRRNA